MKEINHHLNQYFVYLAQSYKTIPMRGNFRVLCPCVSRKFVDWDVPAAMGSLLSTAYWVSPDRRQFRSAEILKNNNHVEGYCVCCLNYKGKEVEECELKLNRLTADKKQRKVRWSPLSETGQKSDSMFATIIRTALFSYYFRYFFSDRILSVT